MENSFIQSWCHKYSFTTSSFSELKQAVMPAITEKISHLSAKLTTKNGKNLLKLKDEIITEKLKMLHNKFAVVPVDKASGNVAFVCQKH